MPPRGPMGAAFAKDRPKAKDQGKVIKRLLSYMSLPNRVRITGEHDRLPHPSRFQLPQSLSGGSLGLVGDDQMSGVSALRRHMDDGARVVVVRGDGDALPGHQLSVARQHGPAVDHRPDAVTGDKFHFKSYALVLRPFKLQFGFFSISLVFRI